MSQKEFKYGRSHAACKQPCPPNPKLTPISLSAIRYIKDPTDAKSFLPIALLDNHDTTNCQHYSLSFFRTVEEALARWKDLGGRDDAAERYGTHWGEVPLAPDDGRAEPPNRFGHFEFHEYADCDDLSTRVRQKATLPKVCK